MSRFIAIAAAVALVVSGIMIGSLGTFLVLERGPRHENPLPPGPPRRPFSPQPRPAVPFTREMDRRLDLDDAQREKIDAILRESRVEAEAIRRELRPKLEAHLDKTRARIAEVLGPAQRARFEALVKEDRRRADRFLLDGPPPPMDGPPPGGGPFPPDGPPPDDGPGPR